MVYTNYLVIFFNSGLEKRILVQIWEAFLKTPLGKPL
jgi:hypothetical protein